MESEINEFDKICRTCLAESDELRSIYKVGLICGEITTLSDMLADCTSLEFLPDDNLPTKICNKCALHLGKSFIFRQNVIKSNNKLRERLCNIKTEEILNTEYYFSNEAEESQKVGTKVAETQTTGNITEYVDQEGPQITEMVVLNNDYEIEITSAPEQHGMSVVSIMEEDAEIMNKSVDLQKDDNARSENESTTTKLSSRKQRRRSQKYVCTICQKILSNNSSYKYHMQLHSDETPYMCNECGESFKTRNAYDGHITTHNLNNPNKCTICGKTYRQASSLRSHMLTHTGEKPFKCHICGKGMTQKSGYKKHMLIHTGEKPYSCEMCGKEFRYSSNLIIHRKNSCFGEEASEETNKEKYDILMLD